MPLTFSRCPTSPPLVSTTLLLLCTILHTLLSYIECTKFILGCIKNSCKKKSRLEETRFRRGITRLGKNKRKPLNKRKGLALRAPTLGLTFRMCLFYIYFGLIVCFARNTIKQGSRPWHCGLIRFNTLSKGTKTEENVGWITPRGVHAHVKQTDKAKGNFLPE